ncbi:Ig-like domain-containing protein [Microbacterium sp. Marseille-Q6965]|uniref:Ig-like domain-containing protein n=1 Tax=Microbacterium sp. Marseille-Q6965 TaxID=2965072 RepID=UPI0021B7ACB4|nr:Ig-like domain-containing protein [Microbacterium sp. Marseille-Q6965]
MTKSGGVLRATGVGVLGLSLIAAGLASTAGSAASAADLGVGEPQLVLIESAHATGKTAVIGDGELPLTSRTIAADPEGVRAQAVSMYPVDGADAAYVLSSAEGEILALAAPEGGLALLDIAPDAAASDPLAVWTVTEHDDRVMFHNGGSTLNLFGWNTADGAEIGTYAPGDFGNNESWRVHPVQGTADTIGGLVAPGAAPELPATVTARYGWGPTAPLTDIAWQMPADDAWQRDGIVEFSGTAAGPYGDTVRIDARYTVGTVGDAVESSMTSYAGVMVDTLRQIAPRTVERTVSGSQMTVTADVRWDWDAVDPGALTREGEVLVHAAPDLGFAATLRIALTAPREVNQLLTGARTWQLHVNGSTDLGALTDGDRDARAFDTWRSGGAANRANPNWVAYYFDRPRQITRAALFEPSDADNIGTVTFQYRNMRGGWEDVSTGPLVNEGGRLALETAFTPVMATGFRAVIEHKSDATWMALSEFEAWGPGL